MMGFATLNPSYKLQCRLAQPLRQADMRDAAKILARFPGSAIPAVTLRPRVSLRSTRATTRHAALAFAVGIFLISAFIARSACQRS